MCTYFLLLHRCDFRFRMCFFGVATIFAWLDISATGMHSRREHSAYKCDNVILDVCVLWKCTERVLVKKKIIILLMKYSAHPSKPGSTHRTVLSSCKCILVNCDVHSRILVRTQQMVHSVWTSKARVKSTKIKMKYLKSLHVKCLLFRLFSFLYGK